MTGAQNHTGTIREDRKPVPRFKLFQIYISYEDAQFVRQILAIFWLSARLIRSGAPSKMLSHERFSTSFVCN